MESRRSFFNYLFLSISVLFTSFLASACGKKPDTETEPSPEWPPTD